MAPTAGLAVAGSSVCVGPPLFPSEPSWAPCPMMSADARRPTGRVVDQVVAERLKVPPSVKVQLRPSTPPDTPLATMLSPMARVDSSSVLMLPAALPGAVA